MSTTGELVALRQHLATHLDPADATRLAWPVIASLAGPGLGRGWTGAELAAAAILGVYSGGIEDPAAYIAANLRDLATQDPPRKTTPTPPPIGAVLATLHTGHQPATDPHHWARHLRANLATERPT
jgi:hypothetical protein